MIAFDSCEGASACVADVIAAGIIPGGMEMMDRLAIEAAEDFVHAGYPRDAEAMLLVELDGPSVEVDHLVGLVEELARKRGAMRCRIFRTPRPSGSHSGPDARRRSRRSGASPRIIYAWTARFRASKWRASLAGIQDLSEKHGLRVANVFHAGDGNLHPLILFDANKPGELHRAEEFGADILCLCVKGRRRAHRRAWRRHRKARSDAADVQRDRSRPADPGQNRV